MPFINCEINLILTWPENCIISNAAANQNTTSAITDTKLYVPVLTLSTQDNAKLFQKLKSCLKRTINYNKYQSIVTTQPPNQYLDYLIDPSFQKLNRLFVLIFGINANRLGRTRCYFPTVKIEDYNIIIDGKNFFKQPIKNDIKTYNIQKTKTGQGDGYRTACLLDYNHFKNHYKVIAIDLGKHQELDAEN